MRTLHLLACGLLCLLVTPAASERVRVAVAASFFPTLQQLAPAITEDLDVDLDLVAGASGLLYAQITQGAPYDLFLSADEWRPQALVRDGLADAETLTRYARGALVLPGDTGPDLLSRRGLRLAIANPATAPYGKAAREALARLAPDASLQLITGKDVGQAFHFAASGNADLALVAQAQVLSLEPINKDDYWVVPAALHAPLFQSAVIPRHSAAPGAARQVLDWLTDERSQARLTHMGFVPLTGASQ